MNGINSILCVVDPAASVGCAGIDKAARVAQAFDAALELLICSVPPLAPEQDALLSRQLEELAASLRVRCRQVSTRLIIGESLHRSLLSYIKESSFDLIVKEAQSMFSMRRTFGSGTDGRLIRSCTSPLLLTRSRPWSAKPTILACIDPGNSQDPGAKLDHCILQAAQVFARQLRGHLHVMHACHHRVPAAIEVGGAIAQTLSCEPLESEALNRLALVGALAEEYEIAPRHTHLSSSGASEGITQAALELPADAVVMGASSRGSSLNFFLGHVATRVLSQLRCDALVVKAPERCQTAG